MYVCLIYCGVLVSITMIHLIMYSTQKRCTSMRWIHSDYRFWVSFGIHLQFRLKAFWTNLSNSSHTVRRLKFPFMASAHRFTQLLCCKFFVSVVIDNSISISLYIGRCTYVCLSSCSSLSTKSTGCGARLLTHWRGVNSTNVLDEGLRIGGRGRWMNSKVKSVEIGVCRK
jgi:hypothetical protein